MNELMELLERVERWQSEHVDRAADGDPYSSGAADAYSTVIVELRRAMLIDRAPEGDPFAWPDPVEAGF